MGLIRNKVYLPHDVTYQLGIVELVARYNQLLQDYRKNIVCLDSDFGDLPSISKNNDVIGTELQVIELVDENHKLEKKIFELNQLNSILNIELGSLRQDLNDLQSRCSAYEQVLSCHKNKIKRYESLCPNLIGNGNVDILSAELSEDKRILTCNVSDDEYVKSLKSTFIKFIHDDIGIGLALGIDDKIFYPSHVKINDIHKEILLNFTRSEWMLILATVSTCKYILDNTDSPLVFPSHLDKSLWKTIFIDLDYELKSLPDMFRYDEVTLVTEINNVDYTALHMRFTNAQYKNFARDSFDVRVGVSLVEPNKFSSFPKIEFPQTNNQELPFDSWYEESRSDYGSKFEIRFALTNRSFDLKVWDRLSIQDKEMLTVFLIYLPNHLMRLDKGSRSSNRSWGEWVQLVTDVSRVFIEFLSNQSNFSKGLLDQNEKNHIKVVEEKDQIKKYGVMSKSRLMKE